MLLALVVCSLICLYFYPEPERDPRQLRYHPEEKAGFMQFDSENILNSIERGDTAIFTEMESWHSDAEYPDIEWTQTQFLLVADALSQQVWDEPLDFDQWNVLEFGFRGGYCRDIFDGFVHFELTYYKTFKTDTITTYIARKMIIKPREGTALWAGGEEFSVSFFQRWSSIDLAKFQITAEQAHQIAEENGAKVARTNHKDCDVFVDAENSWLGNTWRVRYAAQIFDAYIDPFNGKVRLRIK